MTRRGAQRASAPETGSAVVLFVGVCNLCSATVRFIAARDPGGRFAFASLQSRAAEALLARCGEAHGDGAGPGAGHAAASATGDGVVLVTAGGCRRRSDAVLAIAAELRGPWPLLALLARLVPRAVRERVYRFVARHRYPWFGRRDACYVPGPGLRARFLEDGPAEDPR